MNPALILLMMQQARRRNGDDSLLSFDVGPRPPREPGEKPRFPWFLLLPFLAVSVYLVTSDIARIVANGCGDRWYSKYWYVEPVSHLVVALHTSTWSEEDPALSYRIKDTRVGCATYWTRDPR